MSNFYFSPFLYAECISVFGYSKIFQLLEFRYWLKDVRLDVYQRESDRNTAVYAYRRWRGSC